MSQNSVDECGQRDQPLTQLDPSMEKKDEPQDENPLQIDENSFKSPEDDEEMEFEDEHSAEAAMGAHDLVEEIEGNLKYLFSYSKKVDYLNNFLFVYKLFK